jgi:hypothetical protein
LCGSTPIITDLACSSGLDDDAGCPRGHSCFTVRCARSSFEPPAAQAPTERCSIGSQPAPWPDGRHCESNPAGDPETLRSDRCVHPKSRAGTSRTGIQSRSHCRGRVDVRFCPARLRLSGDEPPPAPTEGTRDSRLEGARITRTCAGVSVPAGTEACRTSSEPWCGWSRGDTRTRPRAAHRLR